MELKVIQLAALGRALHPGTLYDCRRDVVIPGISLWDNDVIKNGLDSRRQPKTELNFCASDSLNDKAKLLDVNASLKASFLCGLVEVGGSASYINDSNSSERQSCVSLQYSQTTRFDHLTMEQLGDITYPDVFEERTATHVVTAVLYGAQAFMVFKLTASENENKEEIEGNLNVMVKKMPSFSIEGKGDLTMNDSEKKLADSIGCTFYGDFELDQNPTTYSEALQLYTKLPTFLRERENDAVPMKVWLYPLSALSDKAAVLERDIHRTLIAKAECILEDLRSAETHCNDLLTNPTVNDFHDVRRKLNTFKDLQEEYKMKFVRTLRKLIPAVRGGQQQEQELTNIMDIHEKCPFRAEKLNQWLECSQGEVNLLRLYTEQLDGVPVVKYSALKSKILSDPSVDTVVSFCFTSLADEDPFLSLLTKYLQGEEMEKLPLTPDFAEPDIKVWFRKPEVIENLKKNFFPFRSFFHANNNNSKIRFVIVAVSNPSYPPGVSTFLYEKGKMVNGAFEPVSKPPVPKVDIQDKNINLKLKKSPTGSTVRFRVEYRIVQATETDVETWEEKETPDTDENFTLTDVQLTKQYKIQYRAVSDVGVSEASDSVLVDPRGKLTFPFSLKWGWTTEHFITELRSKLMIQLGSSQWIPSPMQPPVHVFLRDLEIPYKGQNTSKMRADVAFHFKGVVPENSPHFTFKLMTSKDEDADILFCLEMWPEHHSLLKTFINGKWETIKYIKGCPLPAGSVFELLIAIKTENYVVYLNGWRYTTMDHHLPLLKISTVGIDGNVVVNSFGALSWIKFLKDEKQINKFSRYEISNVQLDGAEPICTPNKPYLGQIPGGLKRGQVFLFQGLVPSDGSGFAINYKTGRSLSDDIAFHFKAEFQKLVFNTYKTGKWGRETVIDEPLFAKGEGFDIIIIITPSVYQVFVNGQGFYTYNHDIPVESVSTLEIKGDVLMNTCAIIHVDKFNVTLNLSAHI